VCISAFFAFQSDRLLIQACADFAGDYMIIASTGMSRVNFEFHRASPDRLFGVLSFNDPARMNAMTEEMARGFRDITERIKMIRLGAIVITGKGRAFSAGGDMNMIRRKQQQTVEQNQREMFDFYSAFLGILDLNVPIVAAINGPAIGAGMCFACACDVRIAADIDKNILGFSFAKLGLTTGMGGTLFLPRLVGDPEARELLEGAENVTPRKAFDIKMVNEVVPAGQLMRRALDLADEIASSPALAEELLQKRVARDERIAALQREAQLQGASFLSEEHRTKFPRFLESLKSPRTR
jgi:enoyl-CoA hydratase/carnithine racemase